MVQALTKKMGLCWEFNKQTLRELYNCPARPLTNCIDGRFLMRNTKAQREPLCHFRKVWLMTRRLEKWRYRIAVMRPKFRTVKEHI